MERVLGAAKGTGGYLLLEQLAREGWSIAITPAGVGRVRATARRDGDVVEATGATVAHLAPYLLARARRAAAVAA